MQELEQLIDARVYAILATERQRELTPQPGQLMSTLSSDERKTVIQAQAVGESTKDGNAVMPAQPQKRTGRPRSPMGQRILDLLRAHPEGLTAEQIRAALQPTTPIGDILQGMLKTGVAQLTGEGRRRRYMSPQCG
jgi:hypothetical protein